jgi:hypothetical protein
LPHRSPVEVLCAYFCDDVIANKYISLWKESFGAFCLIKEGFYKLQNLILSGRMQTTLWIGCCGCMRTYVCASAVTNYIFIRCFCLFQRVFVIPNMDDLVVPILRASHSNDGEEEQEASS